MTTELAVLAGCRVKIGGSDISTKLYSELFDVEVFQNLYLPGMFVIRFYDPNLDLFANHSFDFGKEVEIQMGHSQENTVTLIKGEITSLEMDSTLGDFIPTVTVRGYDKRHRLQRGRKTRTFLQMSDSDIFSKVGKECGLSVSSVATSPVHDYVMQNDESNFEFLQRRATRLGLEIVVDNNTLKIRQPAVEDGPEIKWGEKLLRCITRLSANYGVDQVVVRGWDVKKKEAIVGTASDATGFASLGLAKTGKQSASTFGEAKSYSAYHNVANQKEAETVAKAIFKDVEGHFIQLEGSCLGDPKIKPGVKLKISGIGTKYSGKYYLTACTHRYSADGYFTEFESSGRQPNSLLDQANSPGASAPFGEFVNGAVIGVVTNNNDAEGKMGRVKVKFPWLPQNEGKDIESHWARIAAPMAGANRGFYFLPEVNDEVLVAFEQGDINRPYIIGALWNGKDAPPEKIDKVVKSGKVNQRIIKTRVGHIITFDDSDDTPMISIVDKTGKNKIIIDSKNNDILVESDKTINIKAKDAITIESTTKNITMKASAGTFSVNAKAIEMKSTTDTKIEANTNFSAKGTAGATLEGAKVDVKANASATVDGGGMLMVKGGVVKIN